MFEKEYMSRTSREGRYVGHSNGFHVRAFGSGGVNSYNAGAWLVFRMTLKQQKMKMLSNTTDNKI